MPAGSLIDRVLDVLDLLADQPRGLSVSEVARQLRSSKSETFRILGVMTKRDFVVQSAETQRYRLSYRTAALALRFFGRAGLTDLCQPVLDRLAARTEELVRLAVLEGDELYFVANAQGVSSGLRFDPDLGRRPVTLHATANGRAWLATLDPRDALERVERRGFILSPDSNGSSVHDEKTLLEALGQIAVDGYSVSIEEAVRGVVTVAAAIRTRNRGPGVGSVSVAGPTFRMTPERIAEIAADLKAAATQLGNIWPLPYEL